MTRLQDPCDNAGLLPARHMFTISNPSESTPPQRWVRPAVTKDAPVVDAWLMRRAPLGVPEARARRVSLDALLDQGSHGICLLGGTNAVRDNLACLMPVTLIHSLSTGGRIAMVAEWWPPVSSSDSTDAGEPPALASAPRPLQSQHSPQSLQSSEWPAETSVQAWLQECCAVLADWCRAHGIRHIALAQGLVDPGQRAPDGFQRDGSGLWVRSLVPTPKFLG